MPPFLMSRRSPLLAAVLAAGPAMAADPAVRLENAYVLSSGAQVQAFRVPAVDANGVVRYYDVRIDLTVNAQGRIAPTAAVTSVKSPAIPGDRFVAGTYVEPLNAYLCTVSTSILAGSRMEGAMNCPTGGSAYITMSWTTGDLTGHPLELDLRAAGIDQIPGYQNYAWGKVGGSFATWWNCFGVNDVISARQVGNQITLNSYGAGNVAECGVTVTLVP